MKISSCAVRKCIYYFLVIAAIILMVLSFTKAWWQVEVKTVNLTSYVEIFGYGLEHDFTGLRDYIKADETPFYQTAMAWAYLGITVVIIIAGLVIKGWRGQMAIIISGLGYLTYVLVAVYVTVANRVTEMGVPFTGQGHQIYTGSVKEIDVLFYSSIENGFYIAVIAGLLCVILGILRHIIIGKRLKTSNIKN